MVKKLGYSLSKPFIIYTINSSITLFTRKNTLVTVKNLVYKVLILHFNNFFKNHCYVWLFQIVKHD